MRLLKIGITPVIIFFLMGFDALQERITIYLVGDSTMADKSARAFPETGWGTPFKTFFDSSVTVENHARNGRSTRTFIEEQRWQKVADALKEGDYAFIQFGHNDESVEKTDRYTTPDDYVKNLTRFVRESRLKGANPVLITPVTRRRFDESGNVMETHAQYSDLVRKVARETETPLIDLDGKSRDLLEAFGEESSKLLFLHLEAGEHPNYPQGKVDNTHFSEVGARKIAQLVLREILTLRLEIAGRVINHEKIE